MEGLCEGLAAGGVTPRIDIFTGTSVGAINTVFLAGNADLAVGAQALKNIWEGLKWSDHLKIRTIDTWRWLRGTSRSTADATEIGPSVFDVTEIQRLVWDEAPWAELHRRIDSAQVRAVIIAALHVGSGRTCLFGEFSPGWRYPPSVDPHRYLSPVRLAERHIMASSAIPGLFPAQRVDGDYYCDGGLRFNTPLAPAIRSGADALIVVNVAGRVEGGPIKRKDNVSAYPSPSFLASRVLNALMLDRVPQDLEALARINELWAGLRESLDPEHLAKLQQETINRRGVSYRETRFVSLSPSRDPAALALDHLQHSDTRRGLGRLERTFIDSLVGDHPPMGDLAAYLLFDGGFASEMIAMGRMDALARTDELAALFEPCA